MVRYMAILGSILVIFLAIWSGLVEAKREDYKPTWLALSLTAFCVAFVALLAWTV